MDMRERIRRLADALPPSGSVVLTKAALLEMIEEDRLAGLTVGQRVAALREERGFSRQGLAQAVGRSLETIVAWESDLQQPSGSALGNLTWALRAPPELIIGNGARSPVTTADEASDHSQRPTGEGAA